MPFLLAQELDKHCLASYLFHSYEQVYSGVSSRGLYVPHGRGSEGAGVRQPDPQRP